MLIPELLSLFITKLKQQNMVIQIVDDNQKFRETVRRFILPLAESIIECDNGSDAVNIYARLHPDFVLMDLKMPVMDGLVATKNILTQFPHARIIIITDYDKSSVRQAAIEAGALAFFSKENLSEVKEFISNGLIE